jgi:hypothetical protein
MCMTQNIYSMAVYGKASLLSSAQCINGPSNKDELSSVVIGNDRNVNNRSVSDMCLAIKFVVY